MESTTLFTTSSSSHSLDQQKDSGYSLSRLESRSTSSTNQGESTLSALIQSHSSMPRTDNENVSQSPTSQAVSTNLNETNRESPDSGHSGSINDFEDANCPLSSELSTSWCTLVATSKVS